MVRRKRYHMKHYPIIVNNKNFRKKNKATVKHFEQSEKDALSFKKKDNLVSDPKIVNFIDCPICGSKNTKDIFIKWGFAHSNCKRCQHIFVKNQLNEKILMKLYDKSLADIFQRERRSKNNSLKSYWDKVYTKYAKLYVNKNTKILDVGCGDGQFIKIVKKKFKNRNVFGSEFSIHTKKSLSKLLGNNFFYKSDLKQIGKKNLKFNLITFWGVLEHLKDPVDTIKSSKKILEKNGKILVFVPNIKSRAFKILGVSTPTINPREHLQFFTESSMKYLSKNLGLKIEKFYQELPVIDLMHPFIQYNKKLLKEIIDKKECYYSLYVLKKS